MKVKAFEFNMFGEMTYVVYDEVSREASVVDPGMLNDRETALLDAFLEQNSLSVTHVLATHLHVDHVMGLSHLSGRTGLGVTASLDDQPLASRIAEQVQMFRLPLKLGKVEIAHPIADGDVIRIGNGELKVIAVPGHSQGSVAFYDAADGFVLTGDALFSGSIGRTDLPGGDYATLVKSITSRLLTLPPETVVYPGHGPATTIGREKEFNPYL